MPPSAATLTSPTSPASNAVASKTRVASHGQHATMKLSSADSMELEHIYSAHNYHPLPVVFSRASGAKVWDPEGREYLDFLSACNFLSARFTKLKTLL